MPRAGGAYSLPPGTEGVPDTTIESAKYNAAMADLVEDANFPRPETAGGTGSSTAVGGHDNLSAGSVNIASATVANLANATAVNVTVTGSTTIEEFGTIKAGVKRFLTFSGALTLAHHATKLILPGGANIATGAGDTCIAQSLGAGNWRITAYQRAGVPPSADASETIKGVVEKATPAEVYAAAADKYFAADLIETGSSMAGVLADAATIAVDWDTFINDEVALTADRTLGNPTNGQPGTYRTILVKGSDSTPRQLSFGNQYLGAVPAIGTVADDTWYLLTIRCITTSHFVVSAQVALQP